MSFIEPKLSATCGRKVWRKLKTVHYPEQDDSVGGNETKSLQEKRRISIIGS